MLLQIEQQISAMNFDTFDVPTVAVGGSACALHCMPISPYALQGSSISFTRCTTAMQRMAIALEVPYVKK